MVVGPTYAEPAYSYERDIKYDSESGTGPLFVAQNEVPSGVHPLDHQHRCSSPSAVLRLTKDNPIPQCHSEVSQRNGRSKIRMEERRERNDIDTRRSGS